MAKAIILSIGGLLIAPSVAVAAVTGGKALDSTAEVHLVEMEELSVPIIDASRADASLHVKLTLAADGAASAEAATAELPALRSAALAAVLEFARLYASPMTPVDAEQLADDLDAALQSEEPGILRVLVVRVQAQRA